MIRYHARWVIPVGAPPLRDACVVVGGDRIEFVGPRARAPLGEDVELGDAMLTPGLVNAHTHLDLAAFAGALGGLPFFTWVRTLVRGLSEASSSAAIADAAMWSAGDQLAHGVTTIGHTGPHVSAADALRTLGARGVVYLECFGPDPAQCGASITDLRDRVSRAQRASNSLLTVGVSPHAPYSVSDALYAAVASFARAESLPVAVHIAESPEESDLVAHAAGPFADMLRARGIDVASRAESPVALLERVGILATRPLCIHAVRLVHRDVERIAGSGASVAHCPRANAWFDGATAPLGALRGARVAVGVGTDSIASNESLHVLAEANAAADTSMTPAERLALATIGGARALGLDHLVGTLEVGKQADAAAFAIDDPRACDADPVRYLLEERTRSRSVLTLVAGATRSRNGHVPGGDELAQRVAAHRARVQSWLAAQPD